MITLMLVYLLYKFTQGNALGLAGRFSFRHIERVKNKERYD